MIGTANETLGTVCLKPEELRIIVNATEATAHNFGLLMLFTGLILGCIIGAGLYRLHMKGML